MNTLLLAAPDEARPFVEAMAALGYALTVCPTIEDAEAQYAVLRPGLVLLHQPDAAALDCCRRIHAQYADEPVVVAALTTLPDAGREALLQAEVDECVLAPFTVEKLKGRLAFLLLRVEKRDARKRIAHDLRDGEAKIHAILNTTVDAIITIDERGRIESFNLAAERNFGYTAAEVIGKNVSVLMPAPYREEHNGYLRSYQETGHAKIIGIGREVLGRRQDGSTFPMDLAVSAIQLYGRRLYTGIVRDISERRRLEQEILQVSEQEQRRIGQDLHDGLGQMLTGLGLISSHLGRRLAAEGIKEAEEVLEISSLIKEADQQARSLARGLMPVDLEAGGLMAALRRLVVNVERLFGISCIFETSSPIQVDDRAVATHLYRIAQESVGNAARHSRATLIKVLLASGPDQLRLRVLDNGKGLPEGWSDLQGMGLRIMQHRARVIGATLEMHGAPGEGTTITCTLPLHAGRPALSFSS